MKQKDLWAYVAVIALVVGGLSIADRLGLEIPGIPAAAGDGVTISDGGDTIVLDDGSRAVDAVCYDVTGTPDQNGINGRIQVARNGVVIKDVTTTTGAYTFDVNQGFRVGDSLSVRCYNNTDDGYYENRADLVLGKTTGAINVPVHAVGAPQVSVYSTAGAIPTQVITLGANGVQNFKIDLDTSSALKYYYRPIIAFKDNATNGGSIVSELTKITISGGVNGDGVVACDAYALSGYTKCVQLATDYVSAGNLVTIPVSLTCGSSDCAGALDGKVVDGVPYAEEGSASINLADSYDDDGTTFAVEVA